MRAMKRSKVYRRYYLICRDGAYEVAMKMKDEPDGWFCMGYVSDPENFEMACENLEEEMRCELASIA